MLPLSNDAWYFFAYLGALVGALTLGFYVIRAVREDRTRFVESVVSNVRRLRVAAYAEFAEKLPNEFPQLRNLMAATDPVDPSKVTDTQEMEIQSRIRAAASELPALIKRLNSAREPDTKFNDILGLFDKAKALVTRAWAFGVVTSLAVPLFLFLDAYNYYEFGSGFVLVVAVELAGIGTFLSIIRAGIAYKAKSKVDDDSEEFCKRIRAVAYGIADIPPLDVPSDVVEASPPAGGRHE